jgi:hypothetical protein
MNGQIFGWDHWTGTALTLSEEVERAEALLTKRPDQTVVALQSVVQFLDVWNTIRGPRTRPARS